MGNSSTQQPISALHRAIYVSILLICFCQFGCVRRRLTIRTTPPGAMVYIDRQPIGVTPVSTSITYYGTRHIELIRDGYRTEKIMRNFSPPFYQIPPLDFIAENIWPWELRDQRIIDVELVPEQIVPTGTIIERAEELRLQAAQGIAVGLPPTAIGTSAPVTISPAPNNLFPVNPGTVGGINTVPVNPAPGVYNGPPIGTLPPDAFQSFPNQAAPPASPAWQPGQILRGILAPGGQPPTSIPQIGVTPGGGYRPEIGEAEFIPTPPRQYP